MIFSNISRLGLNVVSKRFARRKVALKSWPNDWVPFHWSRPETVPGYLDKTDLAPGIPHPDPKDILPELRGLEELNKLDPDDPVRKIFSLDHARRRRHSNAHAEEHWKRLGLIHEVDFPNSLEAKIVDLTYKLRYTLERVKNYEGNRYKNHIKTRANDVKYRRFKYLCNLQELHRERFERIKKVLDLEPPKNLINVPRVPQFRKTLMRELAIKYAQELKEKKVDEYVKSLEKEKIEFEQYKKDTLKWIEEAESQLAKYTA